MSDPLILYHGSTSPLPEEFRLKSIKEHRGGIHLGSLAQARMRAGQGPILEVALDLSGHIGSVPRVRDQEGSWTNLLKRRARAGQQVLIYLNRYEGVSEQGAIALSGLGEARVQRMSDRDFLRYVPEAHDSYVVIDIDLVRILRVLPSKPTAKQGVS